MAAMPVDDEHPIVALGLLFCLAIEHLFELSKPEVVVTPPRVSCTAKYLVFSNFKISQPALPKADAAFEDDRGIYCSPISADTAENRYPLATAILQGSSNLFCSQSCFEKTLLDP